MFAIKLRGLDICEDTFLLCKKDWGCAAALTVFEQKMSQRIVYLREHYAVPAPVLPHDDDLWFSMSRQEMEFYSMDMASMPEIQRLIDLGFVRRRFIARPGNGLIRPAATQFFHDEQGPFIIVHNPAGEYRGTDGKIHTALKEGYVHIERQYACCIETVNAGLVSMVELGPCLPPPPSQRWHPVMVRKAEK